MPVHGHKSSRVLIEVHSFKFLIAIFRWHTIGSFPTGWQNLTNTRTQVPNSICRHMRVPKNANLVPRDNDVSSTLQALMRLPTSLAPKRHYLARVSVGRPNSVPLNVLSKWYKEYISGIKVYVPQTRKYNPQH